MVCSDDVSVASTAALSQVLGGNQFREVMAMRAHGSLSFSIVDLGLYDGLATSSTKGPSSDAGTMPSLNLHL